jgi:hypothetical protein
MKIINDKHIIDCLDSFNDNVHPKFSLKQLQIHIDYVCGCKITQDNKGNSLFPYDSHDNYFNYLRNGKILHKVLH